MDLWGRIFGSKVEEEGEDQNDQSVQISEEIDTNIDAVPAYCPVASPQIIQARQDFSREYWRDSMQSTRLFAVNNVPISDNNIPQYTNAQASTGDDYRYLPQ